MSRMPERFVFFDVDGTLLRAHGVGKESFKRAAREVFGVEETLDHINFAGNTDLAVLQQLAVEWGRELTPENTAAFFEVMTVAFREVVSPDQVTVLPGVANLFKCLRSRPELVLGLITGNVYSSAHAKVEAAGLGDCFELGGYGDDHADRNHIAAIALQRAQKKYPNVSAQPVLVGDTPNDIAAALSMGAQAIAVATGHFSADELFEAGAHVVLNTLEETERVLAAIGGDLLFPF